MTYRILDYDFIDSMTYRILDYDFIDSMTYRILDYDFIVSMTYRILDYDFIDSMTYRILDYDFIFSTTLTDDMPNLHVEQRCLLLFHRQCEVSTVTTTDANPTLTLTAIPEDPDRRAPPPLLAYSSFVSVFLCIFLSQRQH